jgi:hypothetical protein
MNSMECCFCKKPKEDLLIHCRGTETRPTRYSCRGCNTERLKKYRSTPRGKARVYAAVYRSIEKHQDKQNARATLRSAVKSGIVQKPKHCERCTVKKIDGHHDDYFKPLEVRWLCRSHHADVHRELDALT